MQRLSIVMACLLICVPAFASPRFYIGKSEKIAPATQTSYTIEYQLLESKNEGEFTPVESGSVCLGKTPPCAEWVGQSIAGEPSEETGGGIPLIEYGLEFGPPASESDVPILFTHVQGVASSQDDEVLILVPNLLGSSTRTRVGVWSETVLLFSPETSFKVRARLVSSPSE